MFFTVTSYTTLDVLQAVAIAALMAILIYVSLKERRAWVLLTLTVAGLALTIISILQVVAGRTSVVAICGAIITVVWAMLYGTSAHRN